MPTASRCPVGPLPGNTGVQAEQRRNTSGGREVAPKRQDIDAAVQGAPRVRQVRSGSQSSICIAPIRRAMRRLHRRNHTELAEAWQVLF